MEQEHLAAKIQAFKNLRESWFSHFARTNVSLNESKVATGHFDVNLMNVGLRQ